MHDDTLPQGDGGEAMPARRPDAAPSPAISTTAPSLDAPSPQTPDQDEE